MWRFANDNAIRRAIHARSTHDIGRFDECSDRITYTSDRGATMLPVHTDLISRGAPSQCGCVCLCSDGRLAAAHQLGVLRQVMLIILF